MVDGTLGVMERTGVVIVGAGTWGPAAARVLAARGHQVLALDRHRPPHPWGSHSGRTRLARRASHEGVAYAPLSNRAHELWEQLEREHGQQLRQVVGGLVVDRADGPLLTRTLDSLRAGGWEHEVLSRQQTQQRFPAVVVGQDERAVWEPGAVVLDVPACLDALVGSAERAGATFGWDEAVLSWQTSDHGVVVTTTRRTLTADHLLLTSGVHSPELLGLDLPLQVERQVLMSFRTAVASQLPALFWTDPTLGPMSGAYGCPEPEGSYKIALHHEGLVGPPDELPRAVLDGDVRALRAVLARRVPDLDSEPVTAQTCLYTNTPDEHWLLDQHPTSPRVTYGTGCSGRSFRFAPAIGEALADLVDGVSRPDLDFLRAARFDSVAV